MALIYSLVIRIYQCYYEAFIRKRVFEYAGLNATGFLPGPAEYPLIPPEYYDAARDSIVQVCLPSFFLNGELIGAYFRVQFLIQMPMLWVGFLAMQDSTPTALRQPS